MGRTDLRAAAGEAGRFTRGTAFQSGSPALTVLCGGLEPAIIRRISALLHGSRALTVVGGPINSNLDEAFTIHRPDAAILGWHPAETSRVHSLACRHRQVGIVLLGAGLPGWWADTLGFCGAASALDRECDPRVLVAATFLAARGMSASARERTIAHPPALSDLSPREMHVATLLEWGLTGVDAARILGVSVETVRSQTRSIYRKLRVRNRPALAALLAGDRSPSLLVPRRPVTKVASLQPGGLSCAGC
jgi:DNA-binding CsgD family transcriptional regulator